MNIRKSHISLLLIFILYLLTDILHLNVFCQHSQFFYYNEFLDTLFSYEWLTFLFSPIIYLSDNPYYTSSYICNNYFILMFICILILFIIFYYRSINKKLFHILIYSILYIIYYSLFSYNGYYVVIDKRSILDNFLNLFFFGTGIKFGINIVLFTPFIIILMIITIFKYKRNDLELINKYINISLIFFIMMLFLNIMNMIYLKKYYDNYLYHIQSVNNISNKLKIELK